jgi:hypothetical protein
MKCMKHLTFLDYTILEAKGKSIDAQLQVKDKQIQSLSDKVDLLFKGLYQLSNITQKDFDEHTEDERINIVKSALIKAKKASD